MKALKILKAMLNYYHIQVYEGQRVDEAISELEQLLSNSLQLKKQKKTCKNCKHSIIRGGIMNCIKLEEIIQTYPQEPYWINKKGMSKFGCNKWESK